MRFRFDRVDVDVVDQVIAKLTAMRSAGRINEYDLDDCAHALTGRSPADGSGFTFAWSWAAEDSATRETP